MLSRASALRRVLPRALYHKSFTSPVSRTVYSHHLQRRWLSDENTSKDPPPKQSGFFDRLLAPNESGESTLLRMLGYYSAESKSIGVGNSLYKQALTRAKAATLAEFGEEPTFSERFELLSIHIYLTLRRLRTEKGSVYERDIKTVMQCIFDVFWTDVRMRMLIKEQEMTLIKSAKWIKECEQRFFGMALAFDEAWDDEEAMKQCLTRNITCLGGDEERVDRMRRYVKSQRDRLDKTTIQEVWDGVACWDDNYMRMQSV